MTSADGCPAWKRGREAFEVSVTADVRRECKRKPGKVEMEMMRAVKAGWG